MTAPAADRAKVGSVEEAVAAVRSAQADGRALLPCGRRSRIGRHDPAAAPEGWLDLAGLGRVLAIRPADLVCEVEAGLAPADLAPALAEHGLELGVASPGAAQGSLGGVFLSPDVSLLFAAYGPPRDQVLGAAWVLADGTQVSTGARVVKSVAGYDVTRLFLGSRGRLAACTQLTLRLRPKPRRECWYRLGPARMRAWLESPAQERPPLRMAFSPEGAQGPVWVQTDSVALAQPLAAGEEDPAEGGAALERALAAFGRASHRVALPRGRPAAYETWEAHAGNEDAFDWLGAVGGFTPASEAAEARVRQLPGARVVPHAAPSAWLAPLAEACAPGAIPFGGRGHG